MSGEQHGGYTTGDIHNQFVEEHYDSKNVKTIWRTFWILLALTILEVGIALTSLSKVVLMYTFIILTIVKAYFIIAYFMHLKHEKKALQYVIILPFMLIGYLIFISITEGVYIHGMDHGFFNTK